MNKPNPTNTTVESSERIDVAIGPAQMPWSAWGDPAGVSTLYQMGYDAWKNWADMQLSMLDACWKMGCLTLDMPSAGERRIADDDSAGRVALEVRLKKVSGGG